MAATILMSARLVRGAQPAHSDPMSSTDPRALNDGLRPTDDARRAPRSADTNASEAHHRARA